MARRGSLLTQAPTEPLLALDVQLLLLRLQRLLLLPRADATRC
jgi:hypothetical protein